MEKDRTVICKIISEMLDNPDRLGIYGTTKAFEKLEEYVEQERVMAIGWCHAHCCAGLDKGEDPRHMEVPAVLEKALHDLQEI